jgi:DNA modification methylase
MNEVADESVHLVVTSPPYWQLKDYGSERQIGFDDTYEAYINNLNLVWAQCHRVLAARNLDRNSVGYEINPDFVSIIREKVGAGLKPAPTDVEFVNQDAGGVDRQKAISRLPYLFKDPVKFDKQVDPRKLQFGSKICRTSEKSW